MALAREEPNSLLVDVTNPFTNRVSGLKELSISTGSVETVI
jgi:hypothetical protein